LSSHVLDAASLVARGYTQSGRVPGGRMGYVFFWPWAAAPACIGALGLLGATLLWMYRLLQFAVLSGSFTTISGG